MTNKWGWFSADEDGKVVSKTEVQEDGSVDKYEYTKPDQISGGHGHISYDSMDDLINDKQSFNRDKDAPESIGRSWKGNGYIFDLLSCLSFAELQYVEMTSQNAYIKNSAKLVMKSYLLNDLNENNDKIFLIK